MKTRFQENRAMLIIVAFAVLWGVMALGYRAL